MKIVIPVVEVSDFETEIHENFGRADYFALINSENDEINL